MMAKSLANQTQISTMLISAEMIYAKNQVKTAFELARKLSPTLMIIEDIDTAGTVSRRFSDHPILGEYLQSMDGMEPNNGIVIVATTNHTENIDPAISDRPGRFDRIIEIPLPSQSQRKKVLRNYLRKLDCEEGIEETVATVDKSTDGLSGAWVREIAQTALIEAMYNGRQEIGKEDLISALKDVLKRRDMAYQPTTSLSLKISQKNAETYTM
jgi:ATP-dependent 26S proteasome regulatory subunit